MTVGLTNVVICDGKPGSRHQDPTDTVYVEIGRHDKDRVAFGEIGWLHVAFSAAEKHASGLAAIFRRCAPNWVHFDAITMDLLRTIQPPLYPLIIGSVAEALWQPNMADPVPSDPFRAIDESTDPVAIADAYNAAYATWMARYGGHTFCPT
jgi:hypothetical protein